MPVLPVSGMNRSAVVWVVGVLHGDQLSGDAAVSAERIVAHHDVAGGNREQGGDVAAQRRTQPLPVGRLGRRYRYPRLPGAHQCGGGAFTDRHDVDLLPGEVSAVSPTATGAAAVTRGHVTVSRHAGCSGLSATALSQRSCKPSSRRASTSAATWE